MKFTQPLGTPAKLGGYKPVHHTATWSLAGHIKEVKESRRDLLQDVDEPAKYSAATSSNPIEPAGSFDGFYELRGIQEGYLKAAAPINYRVHIAYKVKFTNPHLVNLS